MTPKAYLSQFRIFRAEKINLLSDLENIIIEEALPSGIDYSADRVQTSPDDGMLRKIERIEKRRRVIDKRIDFLTEKMTEIKDEINAVEDETSKRLLWLKYVDGARWEVIAEELQYSEDHTKGRLHNDALSLFGQRKHEITRNNTKKHKGDEYNVS